jgi:hypothetical protein
MAGGNDVSPGSGAVEKLMQLAMEQGSVTPEEIAECLDTAEVPVSYERQWGVGKGDD